MEYVVDDYNIIVEVEPKRETSLARRRRMMGYSQSMLAQKSGVSLRTIQQYESYARDINKASGQTLFMLARALECPVEHIVDIYVDSITDCIVERKTGTVYHTKYELVHRTITKAESKSDLNHGWKFDWNKIQELGYEIYELFTPHDNRTQGRISCIKQDGFYYVDHVEGAPTNIGSTGEYIGVGGNLFAIVCKKSIEEGLGGFVAFDSKLDKKLMDNYREKLGAVQIGNSQRMIIDSLAAQNLVDKYFNEDELC